MSEMESIAASVMAIVAAVGTLIARWKGTNPEDGVVKRIATVFDVTQIFDSTRKLSD